EDARDDRRQNAGRADDIGTADPGPRQRWKKIGDRLCLARVQRVREEWIGCVAGDSGGVKDDVAGDDRWAGILELHAGPEEGAVRAVRRADGRENPRLRRPDLDTEERERRRTGGQS